MPRFKGNSTKMYLVHFTWAKLRNLGWHEHDAQNVQAFGRLRTWIYEIKG